jgi:hypothetical protein
MTMVTVGLDITKQIFQAHGVAEWTGQDSLIVPRHKPWCPEFLHSFAFQHARMTCIRILEGRTAHAGWSA